MNVLAFTTVFPSVPEPIRGVYNLRRFQALTEFCAVRVVAPVPMQRRVKRPWEWFGAISSFHEGLPVSYPTSWAVPRVMPRWYTSQMYLSTRSHVAELRKEFAFDVILGAFAYPDVVVAARFARDFGCPLVALVMGSDINVLGRQPICAAEIRAALCQAHSVIALSGALKRGVVSLGVPADRIVVQHNGVDGERFTVRNQLETRRALGLPSERKVICFIGNLEAEKGPDVLLQAVALMGRSICDSTSLIFVGDGHLKEDLQSTARAMPNAEIRFIGRKPHEEIPLWMSAADVLCLPSRREGCPNVILESLASGCPVVACDVGGVSELVNQSNGFIVPSEDPAALARGLESALTRRWDPRELRASVASLSWRGFGRSLHDRLQASLDDSG